MVEKAYKTMGLTGGASIAIGTVIIIIGFVAGILAIISGASLLKNRKGLMF